MLELNISSKGYAAAKRSYDHFSLRSSESSNINLDNKNCMQSRDIVALNIEGPVLSENQIFKLW